MANFTELESYDSGSNYNFGDKMISPSFPRSAFDLTHLVSGTYDNCGIVYPVAWLETLPTDEFDIDVKALVRVLPQVVPLYSRQRLYLYAFWSRLSDLYVHFNTFMKKGYSGNVIKKIPTLNDKNCVAGAVQYNSFGHLMGLPVGYDYSDSNASEVTALPFMACFRVMRDYFTNRNFYIDDRILLPDDDSRFRLNDDGELLSAKDIGVSFKFEIHDFNRDSSTGSQVALGYHTVDVSGVIEYRFNLFTHDYPSDYFTSALPFPQRGDTPELSLVGNDLPVSFKVGDSTFKLSSADGTFSAFPYMTSTSFKTLGYVPVDSQGALSNFSSFFSPNFNASTSLGYNLFARSEGGSSVAYATGSGSLSSVSDFFVPASSIGKITLNQLRELSVAQTELEKMARTDGSYAQFGMTFFGRVSKNAEDFRPVYVGGTYTNIMFTEVLQTSQQYNGSSPVGAPLGTYGGHGIGSLDNRSYIGHLSCDDYGILTIFACIMPDVYYSQGLERKWTRLLQSEFYLPERSKLGLTPILNEELFYDPSDSQAVPEMKNKYLWAYQNPFDDYRYQANKITGSIANPNSIDFTPYTQSRIFSQLPTWSHDFVQASKIRKDYLSAPSEFAYTAQFRLGINAVRPLPYKPVPASILA